ncbi:transposase, partial [Sulfolobus sp. A20-N-G8]
MSLLLNTNLEEGGVREKGIGIIWLKIQPSLDEWVLKPTSCEAMKMKL